MRRWQQIACVAIIVVLCGARFVRLGDTPAGFYLDEAAGAATMLCIEQPGLFFEEIAGTGTFFTPAYVYSGALWTKGFGSSIAAIRAHVALYSVLTIVAVFLIARLFLGLDGGLLAALAGAISPWGFLFSRIAWDPPLAPCFLMWGVYCFLRRSRGFVVVAGVLFSAAMYTYPPLRLHVPLIVLMLIALDRDVRRAAVVVSTMAIVCAPLVWLTVDGTLTARANALAVWSTDAPLRYFVRGLARHLSPRFLVLYGDSNPRHGAQMFGVLSWLDLIAFAGLATLARANRKLLVLAAFAFFTALTVASLTWEGVPHALRAIAGWPFVSLLTGALLAPVVARWRIAPWVVLIAAIAFSAAFLNVYFTTYRAASAGHFDAVLREEAEKARVSGEWGPLRNYESFYPREALRYYELHYAGQSCEATALK
jgi:uncharacterized membrane protein